MTAPQITVTVILTERRTGLSRTWRVRPLPVDLPGWTALIDRCPWDEAEGDTAPPDADRFVWRIEVRGAGTGRHAYLPQPRLPGPWLTLVHAVQAAQIPQSR